jgi:hypothetical protein
MLVAEAAPSTFGNEDSFGGRGEIGEQGFGFTLRGSINESSDGNGNCEILAAAPRLV